MKLFKKWWFWIIAVIIIGAIASSGGGKEEVVQPITRGLMSTTHGVTTIADTTTQVTESEALITEMTISTTPSITLASFEEINIYFLDVGQADSILIRTGRSAMLIDAGNNNDGAGLVTYISSLGIEHIDILVATHPHEDHIGGMDDIINAFRSDKIYMPDLVYGTEAYGDMMYAIRENDVEIIYPNVLDVFEMDGIIFTVLSPAGSEYDDTNDYSIVLRMNYGNVSFLFTGDAETKAETEMRSNDKINIDIDVLKASHHGSGTSSTARFVYKASPQYVVISVGADNSYGHPDHIIMNRFETYGVDKIYRTDKDGTVIVTTNGSDLIFTTEDTKIDGRGSAGLPTTTTVPVSTTAPVPKTLSIEIVVVDKKAEIVTLKNKTATDIDMTGWRLVSVKGNQAFNFPSGYILKANSTITISSGDTAGDLHWSKSNIWNNSESDPAELYNGATLIDRWDD